VSSTHSAWSLPAAAGISASSWLPGFQIKSAFRNLHLFRPDFLVSRFASPVRTAIRIPPSFSRPAFLLSLFVFSSSRNQAVAKSRR
jgi:hypothetical protein